MALDRKYRHGRAVYDPLDPQETIQLPRDQTIKRLWLRLVMDVNQPGGGVITDDNPLSFIRNIEVSGTIAGQSHRIKNFSGPLAFETARMKRGPRPFVVRAGTGNNCILEACFPIDFYATDMESPAASLLPAYAFSDLHIRFNFGDGGDIAQGAAVVINSAFVDVHVHDIQGLKGEYALNIEDAITLPVLATQANLEQQLPLEGLYKSILMRCSDPGVNGKLLTNALISGDVRVEMSGGFRSRQLNWAELQAQTKWISNLVTEDYVVDNAGVRAVAGDIRPALNTGYARIDFSDDASDAGLIPAPNLSVFKIISDVLFAGTTPQIEFLLNRFVPAVGQAGG